MKIAVQKNHSGDQIHGIFDQKSKFGYKYKFC